MRTSLVLSLVVLAAAPLPAQRRSDIITAEEIARMTGKGGTAYNVVQALRPRWLRTREIFMHGEPSDMVQTAGPHVYINDHDQGDVDFLRTIPAELVAEMRWLSANQAASRFGPTNGPAIVVTLKL